MRTLSYAVCLSHAHTASHLSLFRIPALNRYKMPRPAAKAHTVFAVKTDTALSFFFQNYHSFPCFSPVLRRRVAADNSRYMFVRSKPSWSLKCPLRLSNNDNRKVNKPAYNSALHQASLREGGGFAVGKDGRSPRIIPHS